MSSGTPYLAADIGRKRTGIAISESGIVATPLAVIEHQDSPAAIAAALLPFLAEHRIATLVIGIPLHADGSPSDQSTFVRAVSRAIAKANREQELSVAVCEQDEHATTADAHRLYPGIDDNLAAACLILHDYLLSLPTAPVSP